MDKKLRFSYAAFWVLDMFMSKKGKQEMMLRKNLNISLCFLQVQGSRIYSSSDEI